MEIAESKILDLIKRIPELADDSMCVEFYPLSITSLPSLPPKSRRKFKIVRDYHRYTKRSILSKADFFCSLFVKATPIELLKV